MKAVGKQMSLLLSAPSGSNLIPVSTCTQFVRFSERVLNTNILVSSTQLDCHYFQFEIMKPFQSSCSGAQSSRSSPKKSKGKVGKHSSGKLAKRRDFTGQYRRTKDKKFFCLKKDCPKKDFAYGSSATIIQHIDRCHNNRTWTCETCHMSFSNQTHYLTHVNIHTTPGNFECEVCQMIFSRTADKKRHEEKSENHNKNVEDLADEENYYSTHPRPADQLDFNNEGIGLDEFDPLEIPPREMNGEMIQPEFSRKVDDAKDGEEVGTFSCEREGKRACVGVFHESFSGKSGKFVRVGGHRIRVRGNHNCRKKNLVYLIRDRKSKRFYFGQTKQKITRRFETYSWFIRFLSRLRRQYEKDVLNGRYFNDGGDPYEYDNWIDKMNVEYAHQRKEKIFDRTKLRCMFYISKVVAHFASPGSTYRDIALDVLVSFKDSTPLDLVERNCIDGMSSNYGDGLNDPKAQQWEKLDATMMEEYLKVEEDEANLTELEEGSNMED